MDDRLSKNRPALLARLRESQLPMQEMRIARLAADHLRGAGYEVTTGVGNTGVLALLRNGEGPVVMVRADMDDLPVQEGTRHARHVAAGWNGTLMPVFQPGEETAAGAQAMIDDKLACRCHRRRYRSDYLLRR